MTFRAGTAAFFVLLLYILGAWFYLEKVDSGDGVLVALGAAGVLATSYMIATIFSLRWLEQQKADSFVKSLIANMVLRMVILMAILFTILLIIPSNHFVFVGGFFILYFLFQMAEIYLLHSRDKQEIS